MSWVVSTSYQRIRSLFSTIQALLELPASIPTAHKRGAMDNAALRGKIRTGMSRSSPFTADVTVGLAAMVVMWCLCYYSDIRCLTKTATRSSYSTWIHLFSDRSSDVPM